MCFPALSIILPQRWARHMGSCMEICTLVLSLPLSILWLVPGAAAFEFRVCLSHSRGDKSVRNITIHFMCTFFKGKKNDSWLTHRKPSPQQLYEEKRWYLTGILTMCLIHRVSLFFLFCCLCVLKLGTVIQHLFPLFVLNIVLFSYFPYLWSSFCSGRPCLIP